MTDQQTASPKPGGFFDPSDPAVAKMAKLYEGRMVPALFGPWAEALVERAAVGPGDRVLDVACGTGAVTRLAAARVGPEGRVSGIDLSPAMLAIARSLGIDTVDWREGDATALPYPDGEFDVVVCQQGLQFVPDKEAAVAEMARVLRPGGRAVISCWKGEDENPVAAAISASAEAIGWTAAAEGFDMPFSLGDPDKLRSLLEAAGLTSVSVEREQRVAVWPDIAGWVQEVAEAPPFAADYFASDEASRRTYLDGVMERLEIYNRGPAHEIPWTASVAAGTKHSSPPPV